MTKAAMQQISNAREQRAAMEEDVGPPELFKMSKFKKVTSRLNLNLPPLGRSASTPCL